MKLAVSSDKIKLKLACLFFSNEAKFRWSFLWQTEERIRLDVARTRWQLAGDGRVMAGRETFGCNSSAAFRGFMAPIWIPGASAAIWMPLWFNREHQRELEGAAARLQRG